MKRLIVFAVALVVVGAAGFWMTRASGAGAPLDQWTWLQREFHLSPAQLALEKQLYSAFQPVCLDHCRRIIAARNRLLAVEQTAGPGSRDYRQAMQTWAAVKAECNATTLRHLHEAAAVMSPDDGQRYLAMMVPRVAQPDRVEPLPIR